MSEILEIISYYILPISVIVFIITFFVSLRNMKDSENNYFEYDYYAVTNQAALDHYYRFKIRKIHGNYRCYIEVVPSFRGRNTSNYMPHYLTDRGRKYICWTGSVSYLEQAKTLCRNWSDATQQFIDTGNPAPGFGR